jgi:hypothetical protein
MKPDPIQFVRAVKSYESFALLQAVDGIQHEISSLVRNEQRDLKVGELITAIIFYAFSQGEMEQVEGIFNKVKGKILREINKQ